MKRPGPLARTPLERSTPLQGGLPPKPNIERRFCAWCNTSPPLDHVCPTGEPIPCEQPPAEGLACGECSTCLAVQLDTLTRWGTPGDLNDSDPYNLSEDR